MTSIGRIIDALFRDPDRTVAAARVDLAYTENETMIEVGPHLGFANGSMVVVMRQGSGENLHHYELEFSLTDVREARALSAALMAWADWAESVNATKETEG